MTTKKTKLLLIEHSPFLRYAFGRLLRLKGYDVREATDAAEAVESLDEFPADLVLANLSLADAEGERLLAALRAKRNGVSVPVVPITGDPRDGQAGARRPVDLPGLLERLRSTIPAAAL